jgi:preprotein translocase subunit SecG
MLIFLSLLICLVSIFLILLILVQRGKGGGLAGAFGGAGGQSAFGTKAGDTFTKVTAVTACVWIVLCAGTTWYMSHSSSDLIGDDLGGNAAVDTPGDAEAGAVGDEAAADSAAGDDAPADAAPAAGGTATGAAADGATGAATNPPTEEGS